MPKGFEPIGGLGPPMGGLKPGGPIILGLMPGPPGGLNYIPGGPVTPAGG
jgi:hypothetical protein